ncbi:LLM class flavin-dependent oxidoreductase [Nocardia arthritidis]|uniref:LLM class flavin-dependent oxidoreductase n=1 Tax=Nocardia arthritidis TaxID=228602 RepID=A0A6G9YU76_9NOCA|nr:LLM class flavin-dependent oxidoreductase [Nocardia arthritidis]
MRCGRWLESGGDGRSRHEQLRAIRRIWTDELAEFHGRFIDFDPMYAWPKPVRQPPIFIGGGAPAAKRAIRHGVGWLPAAVSDPAEIPAQLAQLDGHDLPVTVAFAPAEPSLLDGYAAAGVRRVVLSMPTLPESETLHTLDVMRKAVDRYLS